MKAQTLEQQIIAALTDDALTASVLAELVSALEAGIATADAAASDAAEKFLDPIASPDANAARARMETTQFTSARLRTLLPRLEDKYRAVRAEEDRAEWGARFEALRVERDALSAEVRAVYPRAAAAIADVLGRAAELDRRMSALHQSRPSGAKGQLLDTELVARNLSEFSRNEPSITRDLKLPDWAASDRLIWPPPQTPTSVLVSEAIAATHDDPRRHSADWFVALKEDAERRKSEEAKRLSGEAARAAEERAAYERTLR